MTQGIISIRKDGEMLYKIVVGHDGMHAPAVASRVLSLGRVPTVTELETICVEEGFGCADCLIVLEHDPEHYTTPIIHYGSEIEWSEFEDVNRYRDTFRVAQFNPRWKYGTADYVEVVDLIL